MVCIIGIRPHGKGQGLGSCQAGEARVTTQPPAAVRMSLRKPEIGMQEEILMGYTHLRHVGSKQIKRHATQYLIKIDHYIGPALLYAPVYITTAIKVFGGAQQIIKRCAHMSYVTVIG